MTYGGAQANKTLAHHAPSCYSVDTNSNTEGNVYARMTGELELDDALVKLRQQGLAAHHAHMRI